jgi:hypothetical protein
MYKWFTATGSEGRTVTGSMIMKIAVFFWWNGNNWKCTSSHSINKIYL